MFRKTPNCRECEYQKIDIFNIPAEVKEKLFYNENAARYSCEAQGFKETMNCYNTKECRKLFKPRTLMTKHITEMINKLKERKEE